MSEDICDGPYIDGPPTSYCIFLRVILLLVVYNVLCKRRCSTEELTKSPSNAKEMP